MTEKIPNKKRKEITLSNDDGVWIAATCDEATRDAIWQYMIDHASVMKDGRYKFYLEAWGRSDFFRRIEFRFNNSYKKTDEERLAQKSRREKEKLTFIYMIKYKIYRWLQKDLKRIK